jgi:glycosyltransferase involved in cell wall biosynthesis
MAEAIHWDTSDGRPELALITNHGYAGVEIPVGGAADTGGQNFYVNSFALALERLGYKVTIIARGGFSFFQSERMRDEQELLSTHVRYLYVPGGGDAFIRKEDIAVALDEEEEWLDAWIRAEAVARGCAPWEVFELVNTHYWDAAVMGMRLVERWRADRAMTLLEELLGGVVSDTALAKVRADRHYSGLGESLSYVAGRLLVEPTGTTADAPAERAQAAFAIWARSRVDSGLDAAAVGEQTAELASTLSPALGLMAAARVLGTAVLSAWDPVGERVETDFGAVDRHVWTPHSLGALKEDNFRDKPPDVVRALKFCERRAHERAVCHATGHFAATSEEIAERLHTQFEVPLDSMFYFPPCVDREIFRAYSEQELAPVYEYLAQKSGVAVETLHAGKIVFETSRMDRTKRKDLLLGAFARVAREVDDCYLFIGGGPDSSPLFAELKQQWAADPVLKERACLLGFIPEAHLAPIFSLADVFASASEMEGFGMSACQAAGCGVAVVLSDLIPFGVQYAADAAILFEAGDEEGLAAGIRELLTDDDGRRARAAKLAALTRVLDWESVTLAFLDHLRRAGLGVAPGKED